MSDFFDLSEDNFVSKKQTSGYKEDPNIYNPSPDNYGGSYKSVFRFFPYLKDKSKSKYMKYSCKLYNPLTKEKIMVDCPSNLEKPSFLWTLDYTINNKEFKKEEPELHEKYSKRISRWFTYMSPVYIKKDAQRPDLENTCKFFKYSAQINNLIEQQLNPEDVDGLLGLQKINPFHLLEGKDFLCIVGKKTQQYRDWSKSKFLDKVSPFVFKWKDKLIAASTDEKVVKAMQVFLDENTPDIEPYLHKEWTEETYEQVAEMIVNIIDNRTILNMALSKSRDHKLNGLIKNKLENGNVQSTPTATTSSNQSADSDYNNLFNDDLTFSSSSNTDSKKDTSSTATTVTSSDSDEYDDLFKDL